MNAKEMLEELDYEELKESKYYFREFEGIGGFDTRIAIYDLNNYPGVKIMDCENIRKEDVLAIIELWKEIGWLE